MQTPTDRNGRVTDRGERMLVAALLVLAVVPGIAGGSFDALSARAFLFAASSLGWVGATAILAARLIRIGEHVVGAGFLVLTIAETLLWVNGRDDADPAYLAGFAGGTMFYVVGLLMIAAPRAYPLVVRLLATGGAVAWAIQAGRFLTGAETLVTDPVAYAGYVLVSATFIAVAIVTIRDGRESRRQMPDARLSGAT